MASASCPVTSEDTVRVTVLRVSPEAGKESLTGKICETGRV